MSSQTIGITKVVEVWGKEFDLSNGGDILDDDAIKLLLHELESLRSDVVFWQYMAERFTQNDGPFHRTDVLARIADKVRARLQCAVSLAMGSMSELLLSFEPDEEAEELLEKLLAKENNVLTRSTNEEVLF